MLFVDMLVEGALILVSVMANRTDKRNVGVDVLVADVPSHATLRGHKLVAGEAQVAARGRDHLCCHHARHSL